MTDDPLTVAVLLAAGAGSRFEGPGHKLLAALPDGTTVLGRSLDAAVAAGIGPVVLVLGAVGPDVLGPLPPTVHVVVNARWADGQASSLRAGIAAADGLGADAVLVALGDQPGIAPAAWRTVATAAPSSPIAVARYAGIRGHPVRLARSVWPLLPTGGDRGARAVLAAHPTLVTEVDVPGDPTDIDTVADLATWRTSDVTPPPGTAPPSTAPGR